MSYYRSLTKTNNKTHILRRVHIHAVAVARRVRLGLAAHRLAQLRARVPPLPLQLGERRGQRLLTALVRLLDALHVDAGLRPRAHPAEAAVGAGGRTQRRQTLRSVPGNKGLLASHDEHNGYSIGAVFFSRYFCIYF